ncbi:hypothetical protein [Noviherbaspirillum pedocola]|uniref:Uncharacterized protein n=1 Tax=Noviherbaspirillum pedocola TaxID=2801341 RepID=A0A934T2K9_9BURK|nr:hypothetical protein [Noviherbaspirillum pedocola]MBK4738362.1 hypothetical protein [Noviherbaspirillum pedocola]
MKSADPMKLLIVLWALAFCSTLARAVEIRFTAEIPGFGGTAVSSIRDQVDSLIPSGSILSGSIQYDSTAQALSSTSVIEGSTGGTILLKTYRGTGVFLAVNGIAATADSINIRVGSGAFNSLEFDASALGNNLTSSGSPLPVADLFLGLYQGTTPFVDSSLPSASDLAASDFGFRVFFLGIAKDVRNTATDVAVASSRVTSVSFADGTPISEPPVVGLLGLGVIVAAVARGKHALPARLRKPTAGSM